MVVERMEKEYRLHTEGVRLTALIQGARPLSGSNDYLLYSYDFGGRHYEVRELVADRLAARTAAGDAVDIWILPERPADPLLQERGTPPLWVGLLIGLVFVLGGLFGLVQLRRRSG